MVVGGRAVGGEVRKRRWVGFGTGDEGAAQQGARSAGWGFKLVSAERRGREWEGSIFEAIEEERLGRFLGFGVVCILEDGKYT